MAKKALCVGINDYPFGAANDLRGCVNDSNDWAALLRDHYDFTDIQILTDAGARKAAIMDGLKSLLAGAQPGDVRVFSISAHGTYQADTSGDEPDFDEAFCPYDADTNLLNKDELRNLVLNVPQGVRLTLISDSCHSGTVTRVVLDEYRRRRFLPPDVLGARTLDPAEMRVARKRKRERAVPEEGMNEILLTACRDIQTAADAYIEGDFHGAMTYFAIKAIEDSSYKLTYARLHRTLCDYLESESYDQIPQLEGKDENKNRFVFT